MKSESETKLRELLEWLSENLDEKNQQEIEQRHRSALLWEAVDRLPLIITYPPEAEARFQPWPHREVFHDPAKMLFNELTYAFEASIAGQPFVQSDLPCTIRANFGTVLIASMFGAKVIQTEDNPPWVDPETHERTTLEQIAQTDTTDFSQGWCPQVLERYRFYRETLRNYPALDRIVHVVMPDLQGPFDNLELLIGSKVFTELLDSENKVTEALTALAKAQAGFARHIGPLLNDCEDGFSHQQAVAIKGNILIRNDTSILVSSSTYKTLIALHDQFVLESLGGGGIHSCGVVQKHTDAFFAVPGIECFDFGQSELNNVDAIYAKAADQKIPLLRVAANEEDLTGGRILKRFPTGVSLRHGAKSAREAKRIMLEYRRHAA